MDSPLLQVRFFATLTAMAGMLCGVPLMGVAIKRDLGMWSLTFGVGLLFVLLGYAALRTLMLSRRLATTGTVSTGPAA